jgi:hypothetical protein
MDVKRAADESAVHAMDVKRAADESAVCAMDVKPAADESAVCAMDVKPAAEESAVRATDVKRAADELVSATQTLNRPSRVGRIIDPPCVRHRCIDSHTFIRRLTDTGIGVRNSCAKRETRSSSSIQRYSTSFGSVFLPADLSRDTRR